MGDLETLLEKVQEAEIKVPQKKAKQIMSGKFTLTDMYEQFEAVRGMGPFKKVLQMLPGMSSKVSDDMLNVAEDRLEKWRVIIQSMTPEEKENPKMYQLQPRPTHRPRLRHHRKRRQRTPQTVRYDASHAQDDEAQEGKDALYAWHGRTRLPHGFQVG